MTPHECFRCRLIDDDTHARYRRIAIDHGIDAANAAFDADFAEQHAEHDRRETQMGLPPVSTYLDNGTLDIGVHRFSTGPMQNDLQLFREEWTQVAMLGADSVTLTLPPGTTLRPTPTHRRLWLRLKNRLRHWR